MNWRVIITILVFIVSTSTAIADNSARIEELKVELKQIMDSFNQKQAELKQLEVMAIAKQGAIDELVRMDAKALETEVSTEKAQ